ncbi:unnamed protein product, partial [Effrenium voratum]
AWARSRSINNRQRGSFSSFALALMLIHVLQRRPCPLLPSLQDLAITQNLPPLFLQGTDCRFCGDLPQIHLHLAELQKSCGPNEAGALAEASPYARFFSFRFYYSAR